MGKRICKLLLLVSLILPAMLFSQAKTGTAGMTFLEMDISARANAMGGSFIGLANDASALYYNPAGIINLDYMDVIVSHNMYLAETSYTYAGVVIPLKGMSAALGLQGSFWSSGDMDETTPLLSQATGRTFTAEDMMLGVTYAQMLTPNFFVGGTLKLLTEKLADERVITGAGDVGTYFDTKWKSLIFGMSIRHFGGNFEFIKEESPLPMTFVFGIKVAPLDDGVNKLNVLLEAAHPSDNNEYVTIGLEYGFEDMFFLRAGRKIDEDEYWFMKEDHTDFDNNDDVNNSEVDFENDGFNWAGTSLGLGFKLKSAGISFDYSWSNYGDLDVTHMLTLGYQLR